MAKNYDKLFDGEPLPKSGIVPVEEYLLSFEGKRTRLLESIAALEKEEEIAKREIAQLSTAYPNIEFKRGILTLIDLVEPCYITSSYNLATGVFVTHKPSSWQDSWSGDVPDGYYRGVSHTLEFYTVWERGGRDNRLILCQSADIENHKITEKISNRGSRAQRIKTFKKLGVRDEVLNNLAELLRKYKFETIQYSDRQLNYYSPQLRQIS